MTCFSILSHTHYLAYRMHDQSRNNLIIPNFLFIILFKILVAIHNAQTIQKINNRLQVDAENLI